MYARISTMSRGLMRSRQMRGDGAYRVEFRGAIPAFVHRVYYDMPDDWKKQHIAALLKDVRQENREDWPWFLAYFKGEINARSKLRNVGKASESRDTAG